MQAHEKERGEKKECIRLTTKRIVRGRYSVYVQWFKGEERTEQKKSPRRFFFLLCPVDNELLVFLFSSRSLVYTQPNNDHYNGSLEMTWYIWHSYAYKTTDV